MMLGLYVRGLSSDTKEYHVEIKQESGGKVIVRETVAVRQNVVIIFVDIKVIREKFKEEADK